MCVLVIPMAARVPAASLSAYETLRLGVSVSLPEASSRLLRRERERETERKKRREYSVKQADIKTRDWSQWLSHRQ